MSDKSRLIGIIGSTVCLLGLALSALAPALTGGGPLDYADFFPIILVSVLGAAGFLGWTVVSAARADRSWLIPLALVAACGLLIGTLAILSNQSAISFWSSQVLSAEERAESYRGPQVNDSKGQAFPESHVRKELDDAVTDANRARDHVQRHQTGRLMGVVFVIAGIVAGVLFLQVRKRGRAGS